MAHSGQRSPWRDLIRFGILPAAAFGLRIAVPFLIAALPIVIAYVLIEIRISRAIGLSKKGYFGGRLARGN